MKPALGDFKTSQPLTLGVELELQLVSRRDFDLTRGATSRSPGVGDKPDKLSGDRN